jgi:MSHA pilin protein MshC
MAQLTDSQVTGIQLTDSQIVNSEVAGIQLTNKHVTYNHVTNSQVMCNSAAGFTLIEVITVIIIIGILSVNVLPKFLSSSGFEKYTYRDELLTKLRGIQQRAMQRTDAARCLVSVTSKQVTGCDSSSAGDSTSVAVSTSHNVSFTVENIPANTNTFSFSDLGRPQGCNAATAPCEITLTVVGGEQSLSIRINQEGYIYAL